MAERACGKFSRETAGRMLECELVSEFVRRAAEDRRVAEGVQRRAAPQQLGIRNAERVRAANGDSAVAYGSLRAAIRNKPRSKSDEFRRAKRRMIHCAGLGGSSGSPLSA